MSQNYNNGGSNVVGGHLIELTTERIKRKTKEEIAINLMEAGKMTIPEIALATDMTVECVVELCEEQENRHLLVCMRRDGIKGMLNLARTYNVQITFEDFYAFLISQKGFEDTTKENLQVIFYD